MHRLLPIHVELAYRDPLTRAGIEFLLSSSNDIVLRSATDEQSEQTPSDVLVADYESALENLKGRGRARPASPGVLIVTSCNRESQIRCALEAGARGYLLLGCGVKELTASIRQIADGQRALCDTAAQRIAESLSHQALTVRETEVLRLVARGYPNKAIGSDLNIAVGTVKSHVKGILLKLQAASRTEATAVADRRGLLGPSEPRDGSPPHNAALWRHNRPSSPRALHHGIEPAGGVA